MQLKPYLQLIRFDKPIGVWLLLWPTLAALWLAAQGMPSIKLILIFTAGVWIMRAAGCILNDIADRKFDSHVTRTQSRPIAAGKIAVKQALIFCCALLLIALLLVLQLNKLSFMIALAGVALTAIYPLMKRYTYYPQLVLGLTFNLGILMAFAEQSTLSFLAWSFYFTAVLWTFAYDTMYGMVDRADDLKIGIKSTAILFGPFDKFIIAITQIIILMLLVFVGIQAKLHAVYYVSLIVCALFFIYQQYLISDRIPQNCFKAFTNNHWAWLAVFLGIVLNYF